MATTGTTTRATVQVTLEIRVSSPWGGDCALDQVFAQAREEALAHVKSMLHGDSMVKLVGEPTVTAVTVREKA